MSEFVDYLPEVFGSLGPVRLRRMFGGHGVFCHDVMIALVADDCLYLKTDDQSAGLFRDKGLEPFQYPKGDKIVTMSYHQAPEEMFDDPGEARVWAKTALDAALRSAGSSRKRDRARSRS